MQGNNGQSPIHILAKDIEAQGINIPDMEWEDFTDQCVSVENGVSASQFAQANGQLIIDRFFETGNFCTTVRSAWRTEPSDDQIIALTTVKGVLIPMTRWRDEYLRGGSIGEYIRIKLFQTLLFDADVIRV